jgi:hypothetical protein
MGQSATAPAPHAPADEHSAAEGTDGEGVRRLSDQAELDRVVAMYLSGDYQPCADELGKLLAPDVAVPIKDSAVRERARLYHSTCLLFAGDREKAKAPLRAALVENPLMSPPDSLTFPPPVVSLFLEVRDEMQQVIKREEDEQLADLRAEAAEARRRAEERKRRLEELERLASQETVVVRNSRWIASVPFGVGQFQNDSPALGWTFLVSETLLAGAAIGSQLVLLDQYNKAQSQSPERPLAAADLERNSSAAYTTLVVTSWSFVGVALAGIIEANLNFVPELRETRPRPLPSNLRSAIPEEPTRAGTPRVAPVLSPVSSGGPGADGLLVGVSGVF